MGGTAPLLRIKPPPRRLTLTADKIVEHERLWICEMLWLNWQYYRSNKSKWVIKRVWKSKQEAEKQTSGERPLNCMMLPYTIRFQR